MPDTYLIGVDVGTTETKTAIFDSQGSLVADASEESKLYYPRPGWVEQDPDEMYGAVIRTIRGVTTLIISCNNRITTNHPSHWEWKYYE
jgi:sugar (pentulose or hexulose) kinase